MVLMVATAKKVYIDQLKDIQQRLDAVKVKIKSHFYGHLVVVSAHHSRLN